MTLFPDPEEREGAALPAAVEVLIIGGGPTGLGAAARLNQLGFPSWTLVESALEPGGLASTQVTPEGFLFDMGGHVIFSHYEYFDELLDSAVGSGPEHWNVHERESYVWMKQRWVPYPFQNNLFRLPVDDQVACINGLIESFEKPQVEKISKNFDQWIVNTMGTGIADLFMRPYNFKVWACSPDAMQCDWLGERVARVDLKKVIENTLRNQSDHGWGPNATFRFPRNGGTGGIWRSIASILPKEKVFYGKKLTGLDIEARIAEFSDGSVCMYQNLISTAPLDLTLSWAGHPMKDQLMYSSTHIVGLGIRGTNVHEKKCWMYFPEHDCPFYRCTVFSLYSESNCPGKATVLPTLRLAGGENCSSELKSGPYWSLMFEISESREKPVDITSIIEETIRGALNTKLLLPESELVSIFHRRLERGYPTPSLSRDAAVIDGLAFLRSKNVWSRGRFGAWKYEVGNQDHSLMQGVEAVDNILFGHPELTLENPSLINGRRNRDLKYTAKDE